MDPVEKTNVPAKSRRQLSLGVFLRLQRNPVVSVYTGSSYRGMPKLETYNMAVDVPYLALSKQEYCEAVKSMLPKLTTRSDRWEVQLMHDKATPHRARYTKQYFQENLHKPLQVVVLPTDSPDLTPCDSHFLAEVKHQWNKLRQSGVTYDAACKKILGVIPQLDPSPYIESLPLRWEACVRADGWHIEQELAVLKLERRRS